MKFSTDCFLRSAVAWFFNWTWRSSWTYYGVESTQIPKQATYIIIAAGAIGWYYLIRGAYAWSKGE